MEVIEDNLIQCTQPFCAKMVVLIPSRINQHTHRQVPYFSTDAKTLWEGKRPICSSARILLNKAVNFCLKVECAL